jgi:hypothetical protein
MTARQFQDEQPDQILFLDDVEIGILNELLTNLSFDLGFVFLTMTERGTLPLPEAFHLGFLLQFSVRLVDFALYLFGRQGNRYFSCQSAQFFNFNIHVPSSFSQLLRLLSFLGLVNGARGGTRTHTS